MTATRLTRRSTLTILAIGVGGLLLSIVGVSYYLHDRLWSREVAANERHLAQVAEAFGRELYHSLRRRVAEAEALSLHPIFSQLGSSERDSGQVFSPPDTEMQAVLSEFFRRNPGQGYLYVMDAIGLPVRAWPPAAEDAFEEVFRAEGIEHFRFRPYFSEVQRLRHGVLTETLINGKGNVACATASPIFDDDGAFQGIVGGGFEIGDLAELVSPARVGEGNVAILLDRYGKPVARTGGLSQDQLAQAYADLDYQHAFRPPFVRSYCQEDGDPDRGMMTSVTVHSRYDDPFDGEAMVGTYHRTELGFGVLIGRSLQRIEQAAAAHAREVVLWVCLIFLLLGTLPFAVTGLLARRWERRHADRERLLQSQLEKSGRLESVGRLAAGIAHDFNNVLTAVLGSAGFLRSAIEKRCDEDPEMLELVETVEECGQRAASLTHQLLAFSRQQVLVPVVLDLNEVVDGVLPMLGKVIPENVEVVFVPGSDCGCVEADRGQLEQVLVNLVINARDAMPRGGAIVIETAASRTPHMLELSVRDTGAGIPQEHLDKVFEPFFSTKRAHGGTGLGLASVHGIVEQSGGRIEVSSDTGVGTCFRVFLPRTAETVMREPVIELARPCAGGQEVLLVSEDDPDVREAVCRALVGGGYRAVVLEPGGDLGPIVRREPRIDLLVTDVVMPCRSGAELCAELERLRPNVPALFMSGYTDAEELHLDGVSRRLLPKPFSGEELLRCVREMLDGSQPGVGAVRER